MKMHTLEFVLFIKRLACYFVRNDRIRLPASAFFRPSAMFSRGFAGTGDGVGPGRDPTSKLFPTIGGVERYFAGGVEEGTGDSAGVGV